MKNKNTAEASRCLKGMETTLGGSEHQTARIMSFTDAHPRTPFFFNVKMNIFSLVHKQMPYYLKNMKPFLLACLISSVPQFMVLLYLVIFVCLDRTQNVAQPLFADYNVFVH